MRPKKFQQILKKYNRGEAAPEERDLINSWYQKMGDQSSVDNPDPALEERYWLLIKSKLSSDKQKKQRFLYAGGWLRLGAAASVVLAFTFLIWRVNSSGKSEAKVFNAETSEGWKIFSNSGASAKLAVLPDGSRVTLDPNSKLKYSLFFNKNEREVYLEGRAFFEVTRNENIPFKVHAGEILTQVIGTQFTVSDMPGNQKVIVSVKSGKVSVFKKSLRAGSLASQKTILTPNHEVVFEKATGIVIQKVVDEPELLVPEESAAPQFYDEAPVVEILEMMETKYGIEIDFDRELLSNCLITTAIGGGNYYKRLAIICEAIGASYRMEGSRIVVTSSGCTQESSN